MFTLLYLDTALTKAIYALPHPAFLDLFFQFFSFIGSFGVVWIALFIILAVDEEKKHRHFVIPFILSLVISAVLTNAVLKPFFARERPLLQKTIELQTRPAQDYPDNYSFPSGHAAVAFAGAAILSSFDAKKRRYFYTIALLIAFSRVYLGFHYLGDIIVGALLGLGVGIALLRIRIRPAV